MTTDLLSLATKPEQAIYSALLKLGIVFEFQSKMMGGRTVRGGVVADFYIPEYALVIACQGEYWHSSPDRMAQDAMQRVSLESSGIKVIYIDALDALRNPTYYCQEALRGISHSKFQ
ncbi:MAG: hypothetical protein WC822_05335 [Candidatus Paceibacterota bacterium]|jgi:G:T-mismatch repair DNA endonuclease (very short patch repair protein)